ncbi:similar to An02g04230 [Aspergillus luchuensis]|uniref:Similar to An02g04230 n=1 Tax=Aspergillus kawachii TaxID=1069201 RepID=A0A146FYQ0_ASPKA|nr:similar to An02g04230 [Aspergillus luchuensis]
MARKWANEREPPTSPWFQDSPIGPSACEDGTQQPPFPSWSSGNNTLSTGITASEKPLNGSK